MAAVRGNERRRGFPRAAATEESTLLIETKERKIAVETSERMNERVRVSFRFVSFRFVFEARGTSSGEKKCLHSRFPSALRPLPLGNPKGTDEKKGKSYVTCSRGVGVKTWWRVP